MRRPPPPFLLSPFPFLLLALAVLPALPAAAQQPDILTLLPRKVNGLAFSPDGSRLAAACEDNTVKVWDLASRKEIASLEATGAGAVRSVDWSPDGKWIARGSHGYDLARLYDAKEMKTVGELPGHGYDVAGVSFCPTNSNLLLTACLDNSARFLDVNTRKVVKVMDHGNRVWSAAFRPDGKAIVTGCADKTARIFTVPEGGQVKAWPAHDAIVRSVAWSPDAKTIATASPDKTIKLWDPAGGPKLLATLKGVHTGDIEAIAFSPDGKVLASIAMDKTVVLWGVASRQPLKTLELVKGGLSVAFRPTGGLMATGGEDRKIILWQVDVGGRAPLRAGRAPAKGGDDAGEVAANGKPAAKPAPPPKPAAPPPTPSAPPTPQEEARRLLGKADNYLKSGLIARAAETYREVVEKKGGGDAEALQQAEARLKDAEAKLKEGG